MKPAKAIAIICPVFFLASLTMSGGVGGNINISLGRVHPFGLAVARARTSSVIVSLPSLADIHLKDGTKPSGKVMEIDSQKQELKLQRGSASRLYSFDAIDKVVYRQDADFYRATGELVIRGSQAIKKGQQTIWSVIPWGNLSMKNVARGQVDVDLNGVLSDSILRGIRVVSKNATYVVDEMRFEMQSGTVTILVTPY